MVRYLLPLQGIIAITLYSIAMIKLQKMQLICSWWWVVIHFHKNQKKKTQYWHNKECEKQFKKLTIIFQILNFFFNLHLLKPLFLCFNVFPVICFMLDSNNNQPGVVTNHWIFSCEFIFVSLIHISRKNIRKKLHY